MIKNCLNFSQPEALVITPVKDSIETTLRTIESVSKADGNFNYFIYNDFSQPETKNILEKYQEEYRYEIIHIEDLTDNPSPNYKLVLQLAQKQAKAEMKHLIIVESDVRIKRNTIQDLTEMAGKLVKPGLIGAITIDGSGNYNFPYLFEKRKNNEVKKTEHSLSFCCTLITYPFLMEYDFSNLSQRKDWFDVSISRKSRNLGYQNYLAKNLEVYHLPHSSRPWKNLKYTNPIRYYFDKYLHRRDRI